MEVRRTPPKETARQLSIQEALRRIEAAIRSMQYGEVRIKVQGGKVVWVDKYERERVG